MREIKFRAWIISQSGSEMEYYDLTKDKPDKFLLLHCAIDLKMQVMQYIGLHDKNGKDIYEGDIIKASISVRGAEEDYYISPVCFDNGSFTWLDNGYSDLLANAFFVEVIGNIYENPELLVDEESAEPEHTGIEGQEIPEL